MHFAFDPTSRPTTRPPLAAEDGRPPADDDSDEEDPDVIIPDRIARPLLVSSQLMLLTAYLAARIDAWALSAAAGLVWCTSLLHWSAPRFSSPRRWADYAAVILLVLVGGWLTVSCARSTGWAALFFAGLTAIGLLFAMNETLYYLQLQRTPVGARLSVGPASKSATLVCVQPTAPGSAARLHAYRRTVWMHLLCVHVLASVLADVLLLYGMDPI